MEEPDQTATGLPVVRPGSISHGEVQREENERMDGPYGGRVP